MQKPNNSLLQIDLQTISPGLSLEIIPELNCSFPNISLNEIEQYNESPYQLLEGHSYEYEFIGPNADNYTLETKVKGIVIASRRHISRGRICPNIYVGRLNADIVSTQDQKKHPISFEVIATKFNKEQDLSYRENYRKMLEDITDKCTDLLLQVNTPITQSLTIDFSKDNRTIYQRFCFVKSFMDSADFQEAINRIISNPSTQWKKVDKTISVFQVKRVGRNMERQLISGRRRVDTSGLPHLQSIGLTSIPTHIESTSMQESLDTPENRFIKHVLNVFLNFTQQCKSIFSTDSSFHHAKIEAKHLQTKLNSYLSSSFFDEVSNATTLALNSPLLQKRSGYREVLNRWLQFDLAAKLIWSGGEDVYQAGKRDIATLYEYWLFFQLYDLLVDKFKLEHYKTKNYEHLFETTKDGLALKLKSGRELILKGQTDFASRNLSMRFSYNRTFTGGNQYTSGTPGSITTTLRPDYTLSIWPSEFSEKKAEENNSIVHIHFDAKYKIQNIQEQYVLSDDPIEIDAIQTQERKGTYKNIDILKMHAYKDAIRRTGGAYILYPGSVEKQFEGFHEVLPGLGAFTITPCTLSTESGISGLSKFIDKVIAHLIDKDTQREDISKYSSEVLKDPPTKYKIK